MCGISGIYNYSDKNISSKPVIEKILKLQSKRGPDDSGIFIDHSAQIAFAHQRLSILDLSSAGHQPMTSSSGRYVIVFNGEIYNYLELRLELENLGNEFRTSGDTEVLAHALKQWRRTGSLDMAKSWKRYFRIS